jgi:transcriptional regulator with XRE-family HTH domain
MLAGISVDYYVRLEQGRDHHPSREVVDALARALQLDHDATRHLHALAQPSTNQAAGDDAEVAPERILQLITTWPLTPATIQGRIMDVLGANAAARALSPIFEPGSNIVWATFTDPSVRQLVPDWDDVAETAAASLRAVIGPEIEDPRVADLIGRLSDRSPEFRRLWARHDVRPSTHLIRRFNHPTVGCLELRAEKLPIPDTHGQHLVLYHAEPGSPSEQALRRLTQEPNR